MSLEAQIKDLNYRRLRSWDAAKQILDRAAAEGRNMTAAEKHGYDKAESEIKKFDAQREQILSSEAAQREIEEIGEEFLRVSTPGERRDAARRDDVVEQFFRRGSSVDAINIDLRRSSYATEAYRQGARGNEFRLIAGDTGSSGGSLTIPTVVESTIWSYFVSSNAMRRLPTTVKTLDHGAPYVVPRVNTHGIATQVASQNTAFAGTDPVLGSIVLNAYDAGQLCAVSNDIAEDSGADLLSFIAKEIGGSIGRLTSQWYITGTGSGQPNGVMTAITGAGTIATGGSLIGPTMDKLIDITYSIPNQYRAFGNAGWLMHDLTAAAIRKFRVGAGGTLDAYAWQPSPTVGMAGGQPDTLLGYQVQTDASVASMASNAKIVAFGAWDAYWIRDVVGLRIERSDDLLFNLNQTAWRGLLRTDANLVDTQGPALNIMKQSV